MFKKISILVSIALFLVACQPSPQAEAQDVVDEFEEFVTSVENKVKNESADSWEEIEANFQQQLNAVDNKTDQWNDEMKERWQELENRYKKAKTDFQSNANQVDQKFDAWKTDVNQWISSIENKTETKSEQTWEEIESTFNDKKAALNEFGDELNDDARKELNELEDRFEAAREAWNDEQNS